MNVVCVGAGPAGLYFAILTKLREPGAAVRVVERNPRGVTYGWGVVFWDDLVNSLRHSDPETTRLILEDANKWHDQEVQVGEAKPARMGGYGYSIGRARLLEILTARAESLGVTVEFDAEVGPDETFPDADLVVAADGANSRTRAQYAEHFAPTIESGRNYYIWLGTRKLFDIFTFAFEQTSAGWVWLHAYRFSNEYSTCIFECSPETWKGLGLDTMSIDEGLTLMQKVFARELDGQELITQIGPTGRPWLNFADITNRAWHHDNVVLMGDAAHTTHFSIGSGTKLALEDAIGLDRAMRAHADLPSALAAYQADRAASVAVRQASARASTAWFENVAEHIKTDPVRFSYALRTRREQPAGLSWLLHRATQYRAGQIARRWVSTAKRKIRPA
ncbi:FAD-dependent monooxygenase [Pseudonocardia spinosispora]|uniref:FAD-dependent monooxygenase n=1 Tax=Pseudonocardia spinosispora TaxID=103441 RepID=UPI0003FBB1D8|nr:FAD-dependent monooxygenase [Pseudonocardia spinosispora]